MHLKRTFIFSNLNAKEAQDAVNSMIAQYDDDNTTVNFELQIENTVASSNFAETRYTLIVYIFSLVMEG